MGAKDDRGGDGLGRGVRLNVLHISVLWVGGSTAVVGAEVDDEGVGHPRAPRPARRLQVKHGVQRTGTRQTRACARLLLGVVATTAMPTCRPGRAPVRLARSRKLTRSVASVWLKIVGIVVLPPQQLRTMPRPAGAGVRRVTHQQGGRGTEAVCHLRCIKARTPGSGSAGAHASNPRMRTQERARCGEERWEGDGCASQTTWTSDRCEADSPDQAAVWHCASSVVQIWWSHVAPYACREARDGRGHRTVALREPLARAV